VSRTTRNLLLSSFVLITTGAAAAVASPGMTPTATIKTKNGEVDKVLRAKPEKGSAAETKQKDELKKLAATLLDYEELAKKSLAAHWDKLTPAQRTEFTTTFRELIQRNYVNKLRSNLDYGVQYKNEETSADQSTVTTVVKVKTEGRTTDAEIVYKLHALGDKWMVWDVITDEVSLMRNYRTQFNKIITEQGYDQLIKKLKTKLGESG
jgi:phospholipid transport system substrate-binding protein